MGLTSLAGRDPFGVAPLGSVDDLVIRGDRCVDRSVQADEKTLEGRRFAFSVPPSISNRRSLQRRSVEKSKRLNRSIGTAVRSALD